jgi:hypothetical protein
MSTKTEPTWLWLVVEESEGFDAWATAYWTVEGARDAITAAAQEYCEPNQTPTMRRTGDDMNEKWTFQDTSWRILRRMVFP